MCDRNSVLIIFLIFKIIILVLLPITIYILYRIENKLYKTVGYVTALFIVLFIILRLFNNSCISNSNLIYLTTNKDIEYIDENTNNSTIYESINASETYLTDESKEAFFYDLNSDKIRDIELSCDNKSYLRNYGSSVSAITTLMANTYETDINLVDIVSFLEENNVINCEEGINFDEAFKELGEFYDYNIKQISSSEVSDYVSNGSNVLVETTNKANESKNFGCEKDYIVIYNINNDNEYSIINPNDKLYSYFCPSNTIGYGSVIDGEQNNKPFTIDEIDSKALRYFVIEVAE